MFDSEELCGNLVPFRFDKAPHIVNDYWSFCMTYWLFSAEASFFMNHW